MGFLFQRGTGVADNFEMLLPRGIGGGAWYFLRDNSHPAKPWYGPSTAFGSAGDVGATAIYQSNFGPAGNLEAIVREGNKLLETNRDDGGTWKWKTPAPLPGTVDPGTAPGFVQGRFGSQGNFEVVAALEGGGLGHWWRDNDNPNFPWVGPAPFGGGTFGEVAVVHGIVSNHLEVVARQEDHLQHFWRDDAMNWVTGGVIGTGVRGRHDFIQSASGQYHIVAPLVGGGMGHWSTHPVTMAWQGPKKFGSGTVLAVGLIQAHSGTLELIADLGTHLEHWWSPGQGVWNGPGVIWTKPAFNPPQHGACSIPYDTGVVAIHAALMRNGKIVLWSFGDWDPGVGASAVLNPADGSIETPPHSHHLFCSGHAFLPDGRLAVSGGCDADIKAWHTFDPDSGEWEHKPPDGTEGRWYPTCTTLPDGQVLTISGSAIQGPLGDGLLANKSLQKFHPEHGPGQEMDLPFPWSQHFPQHLPTIDLYPFVFVLQSGKLFVHARNVTRFYDPENNKWDPEEILTKHPFSRTYPVEGSAVLLPLEPPNYHARVLVVGGGGANPEQATNTTPATATAEIMDLNSAPAKWRKIPSMAYPRVMPDATLLPDGSVVVIGGSLSGRADEGVEPVYAIELFDSKTETWRTLCNMNVPRLYHSTALLLPDARVLIMGKDALNNPDPYHYPDHRGEVFSPPYLFAGARPSIAAAPGHVGYGHTFQIGTPEAGAIDAVHVMRPASVTHSFNMEQRLVALEITARSGGEVTVKAPPGPTLAPPGTYMLFLLMDGVPSVAHFFQLS